MRFRRLLRQSRPHQDLAGAGRNPAIQFPLTAKSPAMQAFVERCVHMAKMGHFLFVLGHPGDLIEAPSLFDALKRRLNLEHSKIAAPGNERLTILEAKKIDVDSLFVPCATQIPLGTQEFMAEGHLNHLQLVLLCYPMHKNMDFEDLIRPSLRRKSICILQYPAWTDRNEDHTDCILVAADIAEKIFGCKLGFDKKNLHGYDAKQWKSVAHMLTDMTNLAKNKCASEDAKKLIIVSK